MADGKRRDGRNGSVARTLSASIMALAVICAMPAASHGQHLSSARHEHAGKAAHGKARLGVGGAAAMVSRFRRSHGLPAVKLDSRLMAVARRQAQAMVAHDRLSHDVDADFATRLHKAGYRAAAAAENIAAGQRSLSEAFSAWVKSPPHRANLLLAGATRVGIAAAAAPKSKYGIYWAMVIATPRMTETKTHAGWLTMPTAPRPARRTRKRSR